MKYFVYLSLVFLLVFNACTNKGGDVKIGFLIHSLSSSRWQMDIAYVKERAEEIGVEIILRDAGGDENMQLKQAGELIKEGVDAIIV
ncbi:MAG: hypothetical protein PF541_10495, partial [Prolixibacteraceae bacterium]|nr:hypothetical protein [Prolixibacteraceae bacterium]